MQDHPGRLLHVLGVEAMAVKLAHLNNVDVERASIAALLHDIAKKMPLEQLKHMMDQAGYDASMHHKLWHAYVGEYIARSVYGIADEDILDAIKYHTTGKANMSPLVEVIFVADWIEENTRDFPGVDAVRSAAFTNIKRAVAMKLEHLVQKVPDGSALTKEAYNQYKSYLKEGHTC